MKICYLILCHTNEVQVQTLIKQLYNDSIDFFVHVDKKIGSFAIPSLSNVFVVNDEERFEVSWGRGVSMVNATLALLNCMIKRGPYDYVCLISGQCFPIKSNQVILDYLESNKGKNYIDVKKHSDKDYARMLKRNELYYPLFLQRRIFLSKFLKRCYISFSGGKQHTFRCFRRKLPCGLQYEFGSSWWTLTYDCVLWMKQYIDEHPEYVSFFEHSLNSDESFFQTIFMASPFRDTRQGILTYLEWEKGGNHPRVLTAGDVPMLLQRPELFARKFDMRVDAKPLSLLDDLLREHI